MLPYPPPSPPLPFLSPSSSDLSVPYPGPSDRLGLLWKSPGLATMWATPRREVNYLGHDGPGLIFGRPPPP